MKRLSDYLPGKSKETKPRKSGVNPTSSSSYKANKRKAVPVLKRNHAPMAVTKSTDLYYEDNPKSGYYSEQEGKPGNHYKVEYTSYPEKEGYVPKRKKKK